MENPIRTTYPKTSALVEPGGEVDKLFNLFAYDLDSIETDEKIYLCLSILLMMHSEVDAAVNVPCDKTAAEWQEELSSLAEKFYALLTPETSHVPFDSEKVMQEAFATLSAAMPHLWSK